MRALKLCIGFIFFSFLLLAAGYGNLLLVNSKDEPLHPETEKFISEATLEIPTEKNGYFAILGWRSPKESNWHEAGLLTFEEWQSALNGGRDAEGLRRDLKVFNEDLICELKKADCFEQIARMGLLAQGLVAGNTTLLDRIHKLSEYQHFYVPLKQWEKNPYEGDMLVPDYLLMGKLGVTASAYAWSTENHRDAIATIAARILVARRMLRDSNNVFSTAIAASRLRAEFLLISEIFQRYPDASRENIAAFDQLLQPLSDDELKATRFIHGEFAMLVDRYRAASREEKSMRYLLTIFFPKLSYDALLANGELRSVEDFHKSLPSWFTFLSKRIAPLFKPNATANLHQVDFAHYEAIARSPRREIGRMAFGNDGRKKSPAFEFSAFNPVGKALPVIEFYEFLFRVHDIDRFIRLVSVQAALSRSRVKSSEVERFLKDFPGAIDPATGERMRWDPVRSRIYIPAMADLWSRYSGGLGDGRVGEISVPYQN